jgi:hypothetical protein
LNFGNLVVDGLASEILASCEEFLLYQDSIAVAAALVVVELAKLLLDLGVNLGILVLQDIDDLGVLRVLLGVACRRTGAWLLLALAGRSIPQPEMACTERHHLPAF